MPAWRLIVLALALTALAPAARAVDPVATCEKKKLVGAARAAASVLRCAAQAAGSAQPIDPGCVAPAEMRLATLYVAAEASGSCPATGNQGAVSARSRALAENLLASVGTGAPSTCARRKLTAAANRVQRRLKAEGRHATAPARELLGPRLETIASRFAADVARAELAGDCVAVGDGPPIAGAADAAAADIVDSVRPSLRSLAQARGISIGAALRDVPLSANEPGYADTALRQFDSVTPEFQFMWGNIEPVQGTLNLGPVDVVVDFAEQHGLALMGTPLVWHLILPPWVNGAMSASALESALATRIQTLLGLYGDRVDSWVVVNEALNDLGTLRDSIFLQKLGSAYIAHAFQLARAADPDALLFINDYGIEQPGPKSDALYALVAQLLQQGVPIDGVGFQMHVGWFFGIPTKSLVQANIQRFTQLGLVVRITEMDIQTRGAGFPSERRGRLAHQRAYYRELVEACVEMPGCIGVDFWGFTDRYTWVRDFLFLDDDPLLFDAGYVPKAAFFGVRDALLGP